MESISVGSNDMLKKQINKIFDSHIMSDNSDALNLISGLCVSNSSNTRRMLVNEIEKRDMLVNKQVLEEFAKVKDNLDVLTNSLKSLTVSINDMSTRLNDSKTKTRHLINQTTKLSEEKKKTDKKLNWVTTFVKHFDILPEHDEHLYKISMTAPLTMDFFNKLSHIERLYEDSKILIKYWFQTPAFDIMESVGLHQEVAIKTLYDWTTSACRNIESPNHSLVPQALSKFQQRQVLFENIIDEYCASRKSTIVQLFIDALTKGTDVSKPIEFYANDPKKYIGDILTWVYQMIPIEKENLSLLLKYCSEIDKSQLITDTLTSIMEAVCPLLNVRAELLLKLDRDPLVLWSITNLLIYYKDVIQATIPKGNLIDTFEVLLKKSEEVFILSLDAKIQHELSHGVKAPPSDLNPSLVVTNLVSFLRELLSVMNATNNMDKLEGKLIVTHVLDPLLHAINETACHLSSTDMAVYLLNCIYHIQCTLSLYTIMDDYNERLQAQSEAQLDTLTSEQANYFVANLNLGPIYTILQEKNKGPLSAIPGMDSSSLKAFFSKFDMFILSPDIYFLPQLALLLSHTHRVTITKRTFEVIVAIYDQLLKEIYNPVNNYNDPQTIAQHTAEEVQSRLVNYL